MFEVPSAWTDASRFAEQLRDRKNCVSIGPGPHHWEIFARLCKAANAKGNLVADACLAAIAIERGCEWITTGRAFGRIPGLKWRHPRQ